MSTLKRTSRTVIATGGVSTPCLERLSNGDLLVSYRRYRPDWGIPGLGGWNGEVKRSRDGGRHAMAGLLPVVTSFEEPRLHFGYRRAALSEDTPLGEAGARYRAHEFHYASITEGSEAPALFACTDALGADLGAIGQRRGSVMGSFIHLIDSEAG